MEYIGHMIYPHQDQERIKKTVLVVDDSDDTREMSQKLIGLEGFEAIIAEDGLAGLTAVFKYKPDIILTDINMPNLNGIEMIKVLKADKETSSIPIIAISAYGMTVIEEAIQAGASCGFTKPIEFDLLLETINMSPQELQAKGLKLLESIRADRRRTSGQVSTDKRITAQKQKIQALQKRA